MFSFSDLAEVDLDLWLDLDAGGFDAARLHAHARRLANLDGSAAAAPEDRVQGNVRAASFDDLVAAPLPGTPRAASLGAVGRNAMRRGELAFVVLAGRMPTERRGGERSLVEAVPGASILDLRLAENTFYGAHTGGEIPLWVMTSAETHDPIERALVAAGAKENVRTFRQRLSLRLTPEGDLFRDATGRPSPHATGSGDLVDALRATSYLDDFIAAGGKYVFISDVDNLGASLDDAILGAFATSEAPLLIEVCVRHPGDRGPVPVYTTDTMEAGGRERLQILDELRLPRAFDPRTVPVFGTGAMLIRADVLRAATVAWTWSRVASTVDGRQAVQFERSLFELSAHVDTTYLGVPRLGPASRFLPASERDGLARSRDVADVWAA